MTNLFIVIVYKYCDGHYLLKNAPHNVIRISFMPLKIYLFH